MAGEKEQKKGRPLDARWAAQLDRMSAAGEKARRQRLRSLTLNGALREFEALCREVDTIYEEKPGRRSHPVGLVKFTR